MNTASASDAQGVRPSTPFLPHHPFGWLTLVLSLAICLAPAWWATLDDLLPASRWGDLGMALVAVGLPAITFLSGREAIFRRKDPSILVNIAFVCAAIAAAFGAILVLAGLGVLVFGD